MRLPLTRGRSRSGRPLATATAADGTVVAGSRDALHIGPARLPWEQVERADWDADSSTLTVTEVGSWGEPQAVHRLVLEDPGRLLELVRERVTATIVVQRRVPVHGRRGLTVVARRPASGPGGVRWYVEYDDGVDPADPEVRQAAEAAYTELRRDVGQD